MREHGVAIGVIATPAASAQDVADQMVAAGITSILNFAPTVLNVGADVDVSKVDLSKELQVLAYHEQRKAAQEASGMTLLVVGISHRSAPIALLERLAVDPDGAAKLIEDVLANPHVSEATVVATCNRLEIYAAVDRFHGSVEDLSQRLLAAGRATASRRCCRTSTSTTTTARSPTCSGWRPGSTRWRWGRPRSSARRGTRSGSARSRARSDRSSTPCSSRRCASASAPTPRPASTAPHRPWSRPPSTGPPATWPGAGWSSSAPARWPRSAVATVIRRGAGEVVVVNRTPERAERLAGEYAARWAPLSAVDTEVAAADVVVACAGASGVLVSREAVAAATGPIALVDLALPHDIDPAVVDLPGVTLVTLADLGEDLRSSEAGAEVEAVRAIVTDEVEAFLSARRQVEHDADRGRAADDGHRSGRVGDGRLDRRLPGLDGGHPRRVPAGPAQGHRQAGPPAHDPGQGARRPRRRLLRRPRWPSCSRSTPRPSTP